MLKDAEQLIDDLNTIESFRNNIFIQTNSLVMHGDLYRLMVMILLSPWMHMVQWLLG